MAPSTQQSSGDLHFLIIPFMAPGHMIPMVDLGRILASRGTTVTVITTPHNASRFQTTVDAAAAAGLPLRFKTFRFAGEDFGLPENCDNLDAVPDLELFPAFMSAVRMLKEPLLGYIRELQGEACGGGRFCLVSDFCHPWTRGVAEEVGIPRFVFYSVCCFTLGCHEILPEVFEREGCVADEKKAVLVPEIPHRVVVSKGQASGFFSSNASLRSEVKEADSTSDGIIVNTVADMEAEYIEWYEKVKGKKVWSIGPVSLCNRDVFEKAERGAQSTVDNAKVLAFLDSMAPKSVVYVSLGSLAKTPPPQVIEIGLGLEKSSHPFIWVVKSRENLPEVEGWLEESRFEERNRGKCLVVRGWASQLMILSHPSVGGFVTHCGWNSTIEGIAAGVPMVTLPGFADQFLNERFVVDVLGTGVPVGVKEVTWWWESTVVVGRDKLAEVVKRLMDGGGEENRRAMELGEKVRNAMEVDGGSSYRNITSLIDETIKLIDVAKKKKTSD